MEFTIVKNYNINTINHFHGSFFKFHRVVKMEFSNSLTTHSSPDTIPLIRNYDPLVHSNSC